jgi:uncharacterized protein DUF4136
MPSLRFSTLALAAALAGCSSMKVKTEYDPAAPYATYKKYSWIAAEPGPEQAAPIRNPQVRALVITTIERELTKKGLVLAKGAEEPDFLVSVLGWTQQGVQVTNYGYAYGGAYVYGPYSAPIAPMPMTDVHVYTDGTLLLDFVDAKTKKLVWRGTATDTLTSPDRVPGIIDDAVRTLLEAYPPKAK